MSDVSLEILFYQGRYKEVLAIASPEHQFSVEVLGALCFMGRRQEAEILFTKAQPDLKPIEIVAIRFYLGIAAARAGDKTQSQSYFVKNFQSLRRLRGSDSMRFYCYQGLGFYRYVQSQFGKAKRASEKALGASTFSRFPYGRCLAMDLYGHVLVQLGQIYLGLSQMDQARALCLQSHNRGLADAIQISQLIYKSQFGYWGRQCIVQLERALADLEPQNAHSQPALLLELANQHLLRGELRIARQRLSEVSSLIYQAGHSRYKSLLNLRLTELAYRQGNYSSALPWIQVLRHQLESTQDTGFLLKVLGLEKKITEAMGLEISEQLANQIDTLNKRSEASISANIQARSQKDFVASPLSEDKLGHLLNLVARQDIPVDEVLVSILESGYLGLLPTVLKISNQASGIVLDFSGRNFALFDQGEVTFPKKDIPLQLYKLLILLGQGPQTKKGLIENLWGYTYHPLRHDSLIYQSITKLRKIFHTYEHWIEHTEDGYQLSAQLFVKFRSHLQFQPVARVKAQGPGLEMDAIFAQTMNARQRQLLDFVKKRKEVSVSECVQKLRVSDMTLRRDFWLLMKSGLIRRYGKARSTRYILAQEENP